MVVVLEPPPLVPPQAAKVSKAKGDKLRVTLFLRITNTHTCKKESLNEIGTDS